MGIFIEDLLHFGNLIDNEVEVEIEKEAFKKTFPSLDFEFDEGVVKIKGKKRFLIFPKKFEFRGREESNKVFNEREGDELKDFGVYLKMLSPDGLEELTKDKHFKKEGEYLKLSILDVFKNTEIYQKVPKQFRDKLEITKYKVKRGKFSIFLTVVK
ncbi:hypothetical protein JCM9492_08460 [Aquifex pyrophilus]